MNINSLSLNRRPLKLSDIYNLDTGELKEPTNKIYYNNREVRWPPEFNGMDEFIFTLFDGQIATVFIDGNTTDLDDGDIEFNNMQIETGNNGRSSAVGAGIKHKRTKRHKKVKRRKTNKRRNKRTKKRI